MNKIMLQNPMTISPFVSAQAGSNNPLQCVIPIRTHSIALTASRTKTNNPTKNHYYIQSCQIKNREILLNPHTHVAQRENFLNRTSLSPRHIFDTYLSENTNLSPSSFHFSVGFYIKICFESDGFIAYSNE